MTVYIYDLSDPRTGYVRYVGKSVRPKERLATHIREARSGSKIHSRRWIAGLLAEGLVPILSILEEVDDASANEAEMFWIASFKLAGFDLTNKTFGGDGQPSGYKPSKEAIEKLKASITGSKRTEEQKKRIREAFSDPKLRLRRSEITRARMADPVQRAIAATGMLGKKLSAEAKKKISDKWTPERKAAHAEAQRALPVDDRWKAQLALAIKSRWDKYRARKAAECSPSE